MAMSTHTNDRYLWRSSHLKKNQGFAGDVYRKNYFVSDEHASVFWMSHKKGVASWQSPHHLFLSLFFHCRDWSNHSPSCNYEVFLSKENKKVCPSLLNYTLVLYLHDFSEASWCVWILTDYTDTTHLPWFSN